MKPADYQEKCRLNSKCSQSNYRNKFAGVLGGSSWVAFKAQGEDALGILSPDV